MSFPYPSFVVREHKDWCDLNGLNGIFGSAAFWEHSKSPASLPAHAAGYVCHLWVRMSFWCYLLLNWKQKSAPVSCKLLPSKYLSRQCNGIFGAGWWGTLFCDVHPKAVISAPGWESSPGSLGSHRRLQNITWPWKCSWCFFRLGVSVHFLSHAVSDTFLKLDKLKIVITTQMKIHDLNWDLV